MSLWFDRSACFTLNTRCEVDAKTANRANQLTTSIANRLAFAPAAVVNIYCRLLFCLSFIFVCLL